MATIDEEEPTKKAEPYALKRQQVDTIIKAEEDSFSDVYFVGKFVELLLFCFLSVEFLFD